MANDYISFKADANFFDAISKMNQKTVGEFLEGVILLTTPLSNEMIWLCNQFVPVNNLPTVKVVT